MSTIGRPELSCALGHLPLKLYCGALRERDNDAKPNNIGEKFPPTSIKSCYENRSNVPTAECFNSGSNNLNGSYYRERVTFLRSNTSFGYEQTNPRNFNDPSLYPSGYINPTLVNVNSGKPSFINIRDGIVEVSLDENGGHWNQLKNSMFSGNSMKEEDLFTSEDVDQAMACCDGALNDTEIDAVGECGRLWQGSQAGICPDEIVGKCYQVRKLYCRQADAVYESCNKESFVVSLKTDGIRTMCENKDNRWQQVCACHYPLATDINPEDQSSYRFTYPQYKTYLENYRVDYELTDSQFSILSMDPRCFYAPCAVLVPESIQDEATGEGDCVTRGINFYSCDQSGSIDVGGDNTGEHKIVNVCNLGVGGDSENFVSKKGTTGGGDDGGGGEDGGGQSEADAIKAALEAERQAKLAAGGNDGGGGDNEGGGGAVDNSKAFFDSPLNIGLVVGVVAIILLSLAAWGLSKSKSKKSKKYKVSE